MFYILSFNYDHMKYLIPNLVLYQPEWANIFKLMKLGWYPKTNHLRPRKQSFRIRVLNEVFLHFTKLSISDFNPNELKPLTKIQLGLNI